MKKIKDDLRSLEQLELLELSCSTIFNLIGWFGNGAESISKEDFKIFINENLQQVYNTRNECSHRSRSELED